MNLLSQAVDLDERRLYQQSPDILKLLLKDRTTKRHIVWGTSSYEYLGKGFESYSPITVRQLTTYHKLIQPRSEKTRSEQKARTKVNAEVFTPTWLVKKQTDFAEEDLLSLSLEDYIDQRWLEITCGEAPYIVTRYDAVSGELLPLSRRVGFLDRKLARISEAVASEGQWLTLVKKAYQASYGYEWQGDSLLLARENLLLTFEDYYEAKFAKKASLADLKEIATIISYNLFQMDGLKHISSSTDSQSESKQLSLFDDIDILDKVEIKTQIKNWKTKKMLGFERLASGETEMKFDVVIGNPPYQSETKKLLYPSFYLSAREVGKTVDLIFPTGWQEPKNNNGLEKLNNEKIKYDKQIVSINNIQNAFPNYPGAEWTNIILWKSGYDNGLNSEQYVSINDGPVEVKKLLIDKSEIKKPIEIQALEKLVTNSKDFVTVKEITTARKPYGLTTDFMKKLSEEEKELLHNSRNKNDDIKIYISSKVSKYLDSSFDIPRVTDGFDKYKVFIPDAWGNMSKKFLGGAYSDIILANPNEICSGTFIESGQFNNFDTAQKHAKYFMTRFFRALLFANKHSIINSSAWKSVPKQDYSEEFWNSSVDEIDLGLMHKYNIPSEIRSFIFENIQPKSEENIINYKH